MEEHVVAAATRDYKPEAPVVVPRSYLSPLAHKSILLDW